MSDEVPRLRWIGWAVALAFATLGGVAIFLSVPAGRGVVVSLYALVAGAVFLRLLLHAIAIGAWAPALGPPYDRVEMAAAAVTYPDAPRVIGRELAASTNRALELHYRLRPRLREIAADRLASGHGVDLDRDPEAARRLVGEPGWDLIRPDREAPVDRFGPGMAWSDLERVVAALERI